MRIIFHAAGLAAIWGIWLWLAVKSLAPAASLAVAVAGALLIIPIGLAGRYWLDRQPEIGQAERVTAVVHYLMAVCLGAAVIEATQLGRSAPAWPIPLPPWLGVPVMLLGGLGLLVAALNLALHGRGAPFPIALTRAVAMDWLYAWTRNPIVLSALAFLVGLGLWLGSGLFLVWVAVVVGPAILVWLRAYEERELEIRFGPAYLEYKARTPRLWPRPPRRTG